VCSSDLLSEEEERKKTIKEWPYGVTTVSFNDTNHNATGHVDSAAGCFVTTGNLLSCQKLLFVIFMHPQLHAVAI
jgi:hypothetical protein